MTRGAVEKIAAALSTQGLQGEDHFCRAACIVVYRADVRCGTLHILAIARGGSEAGEEREKEVEGHPYRKTHIPSTDLNPTIQIQICMFMNLWLVIFPFLLSCIARFGSFIPSFFFRFISNCSLVNFLMFEGEVWITSTGLIPHISQVNPQLLDEKTPPTKTKKTHWLRPGASKSNFIFRPSCASTPLPRCAKRWSRASSLAWIHTSAAKNPIGTRTPKLPFQATKNEGFEPHKWWDIFKHEYLKGQTIAEYCRFDLKSNL